MKNASGKDERKIMGTIGNTGLSSVQDFGLLILSVAGAIEEP